MIRHSLLLSFTLMLGGCMASATSNVELENGPPVRTISTPYDTLIQCVSDQNTMQGSWAVGEILDQTGKIAVETDGTGRFISQGAGDMMQTSLLSAGAETTVNRRDPRPVLMEVQWGLRQAKAFKTMDYYITGSINTLDFLPGASAELTIAGIGPRYRQHRAIVGLDLHLTNANTTEVISAVNISKQIFAEEAGFGIGRFFGTTLVDFGLNGGNREPLQLSLRSMLQYGLYRLLSAQSPQLQTACQHIVDGIEGIDDREHPSTGEKETPIEVSSSN